MLLLDNLKNKKQFSKLDLSIVDYILENPKEVTDLTIEELAKVTYTSPSSIVRLCKKLGVKGYSDFRIKLASEINSFLIDNIRIEVDMPIKVNSSFNTITKTFLNLHYQALLDTYNILDKNVVEEAVDLIYKADCISINGNGPSLIIAQDFGWKLSKLGIPVISSPLDGFDNFMKIRNSKTEVGIIISNYGNGHSVKKWMNTYKNNGTKVIMICSNKNSLTFKKADVKILIGSNEKDRVTKLGAFASRTTMLYVLDIMYSMIFLKDYSLNIRQQIQFKEFLKSTSEYEDYKKE